MNQSKPPVIQMHADKSNVSDVKNLLVGDCIANCWYRIREETELRMQAEPILTSFFHTSVLAHESLVDVLVDIVTLKLDAKATPAIMLRSMVRSSLADEDILNSICTDLCATLERDPACRYLSTALLFYKGFQSLVAWRVANQQWKHKRHSLALYLQSRISEVFGVDIHPAAQIGKGILFDHATGLVIGETAIVEDDVSFYHGVTLGWNGKDRGKRHPTIRRGALLSAGASVLGDIEIGEGCRVAATAVCLTDMPPHTTVAGVPAKIVHENHTTNWWEEKK